MEATRHGDPEFIARLALALEQLESDRELDLPVICGDRPDLISELEAAIADAEALPRLHRAAANVDPMLGQTVGGHHSAG